MQFNPAMANALGILLKSFGFKFDVARIEADYEQVKVDLANWGTVIVGLKEQMDRIEALLIKTIEAKQENTNG